MHNKKDLHQIGIRRSAYARLKLFVAVNLGFRITDIVTVAVEEWLDRKEAESAAVQEDHLAS